MSRNRKKRTDRFLGVKLFKWMGIGGRGTMNMMRDEYNQILCHK